MEHVSFDKILSYSEDLLEGKVDFEIEGHLATCDRCHGIFMGLKAIGPLMKSSFKNEAPSPSCPEEWEIGALIKKELPSDISDNISEHIRECGYCIEKAAVYYNVLSLENAPFEAPELWKSRAVNAIQEEKSVKEEVKVPILQRITDFINDLLAIPLPAAAGYAAALLAVIVFAWIAMPDKAKIITVASSEKITLRNSEIPSSFGFTGAGETRDLKEMDIFHKGTDIVFQWKHIEGSEAYEFTLKDSDLAIYSKTIEKDAEIALSSDLVNVNTLYSWLITGTTGDGKYFEYTGDFLLVK